MLPLLIIKTGSSVPTLEPSFGDFEDWIAAQLDDIDVTLDVCRVDLDQPLPEIAEFSGAIVSGSSAMVTDRLEWSERTAKWLAEAVATDLPILGICYGHQLLAHALDGRVARNPSGREIGTVAVRLTGHAATDPLFGQLPTVIEVQETHSESVSTLPSGAVHLAESDLVPHQAFRIEDSAWGVQFHPEFSRTIIRGYLESRREAIESEGIDVDRLIREAKETPFGRQILRRFAEIVQRRAPA